MNIHPKILLCFLFTNYKTKLIIFRIFLFSQFQKLYILDIKRGAVHITVSFCLSLEFKNEDLNRHFTFDRNYFPIGLNLNSKEFLPSPSLIVRLTFKSDQESDHAVRKNN